MFLLSLVLVFGGCGIRLSMLLLFCCEMGLLIGMCRFSGVWGVLVGFEGDVVMLCLCCVLVLGVLMGGSVGMRFGVVGWCVLVDGVRLEVGLGLMGVVGVVMVG